MSAIKEIRDKSAKKRREVLQLKTERKTLAVTIDK